MKVAIIGRSGRMGRIHEATTREWGAEIVWDDDADFADVVVIASPDYSHAKYIGHHLTAGQRVFSEKPLFTTAEQKRLVEEALEHVHNYQIMGGSLGCHLPLRQFANEFELEGTTVDLCYDYGRKTKFLNSWRNDPDYDLVMGGGIHLMDLWMHKTGIHEIDVQWTSKVKVSGEAKCPDLFMGRFTAGPYRGTLTVDFTRDGPHRHIINGWINEKPADKSYQLRAFLDNPRTDTAAIAAHRACLKFRSAT